MKKLKVKNIIMAQQRRQRVSFKATQVVSKPVRISFQTKSGREVSFKAEKSVPKIVQVEFLARRK